MIDESENRSSELNEQRDRKKREITGDKSTSQEIDGVVPIWQSRCKHAWAPSPAGDEH